MSTKTITLLVFTILIVSLLLAAQCSARPAEPAAQTAQETETKAQAGEATIKVKGGEHSEPIELLPVDLKVGARLKVVATTTIVSDLVSNVGGDLIDLTTMLPTGSDPHTFAPTPQDAAAVADAHIVIVNGLGLETFLEELIKNAGGKATVVPVSMGVETHQFGAGEERVLRQEEEEPEHNKAEYGHQNEGGDPHVWMSPAKAIVMVHNIENALSDLDPANAKVYEANARAYLAQLEALDEWVKEQIKSIPAKNRELVADHSALGYYADRYGLKLVGAVIPAYSTNTEPSAQELAALQDAISEFEVKAVFVGATANPVLAERLAGDSGIQVVPLYIGSLGAPGSGAETYIDYIRYNTTAIANALK